ncbi:MAG: putative toxin-antitoxin system toxin component, PIN family [Oscillospiraceae bacterium]|nr:putative toxin-antitoxin system toxin component, PIN family [Oscillospiraceae bacterium]
MLVVLDTNVLVSALLNPGGTPDAVVQMCLRGEITPVINEEILFEYRDVLRRSKFSFALWKVDLLLLGLRARALPIAAKPLDAAMPDESDRIFYETAKACNGYVVTGNLKHYPKNDPCVVTARDVMEGKRGTLTAASPSAPPTAPRF